MRKAIAIAARPSQTDTAWLAVLRFVLVSGCASTLILARYPLPFCLASLRPIPCHSLA